MFLNVSWRKMARMPQSWRRRTSYSVSEMQRCIISRCKSRHTDEHPSSFSVDRSRRNRRQQLEGGTRVYVHVYV